jgi:tetratricopeptide (TPR) repeat protein
MATKRFNSRLALLAAHGLALAALATGYYLRGSGREDPELVWKHANAMWSSGRLDDAEAMLARLAKLRAPTVADRLLRAQVAKDRGRLDEAVAALDGVSDHERGAALVWRTRGMLEFERDRAGPAEAASLHALALAPGLAEARRDLINLYTVEWRPQDLAAQFRALAATSALRFEDLYLWCQGRRLDLGPADVAAKLERMLAHDPHDRWVRLALAENLRKLGRLDLAETILAALPLDDADARALRASVALDRGAVDQSDRLLAEGPADQPRLARLRGRLALAKGDPSAAGFYRLALAGDPDDRDTLFGLGQALRLGGKSEEARSYLEAAAARDRLEWLIENARSLSQRDDPGVLRKIGESCQSLGRLHEARAWYRLALAHDPADAGLQKRLFALDAAIAGRTQ